MLSKKPNLYWTRHFPLRRAFQMWAHTHTFLSTTELLHCSSESGKPLLQHKYTHLCAHQTHTQVNPVPRQFKPITVQGQMVNLHNIHFPASIPLHLPVIPTAELWHCRRVSQATWLELAQFIKPGPVHRPEFTRWRHLQQTAATHSWWEGQADVQGQSKEGRGKFTI